MTKDQKSTNELLASILLTEESGGAVEVIAPILMIKLSQPKDPDR